MTRSCHSGVLTIRNPNLPEGLGHMVISTEGTAVGSESAGCALRGTASAAIEWEAVQLSLGVEGLTSDTTEEQGAAINKLFASAGLRCVGGVATHETACLSACATKGAVPIIAVPMSVWQIGVR